MKVTRTTSTVRVRHVNGALWRLPNLAGSWSYSPPKDLNSASPPRWARAGIALRQHRALGLVPDLLHDLGAGEGGDVAGIDGVEVVGDGDDRLVELIKLILSVPESVSLPSRSRVARS